MVGTQQGLLGAFYRILSIAAVNVLCRHGQAQKDVVDWPLAAAVFRKKFQLSDLPFVVSSSSHSQS